jgi:uncharacterized membrane protein
MDGIFILLILLVVGCVLCGPAALIIGIIALNRLNRQRQSEYKPRGTFKESEVKEPVSTVEKLTKMASEIPPEKVPEPQPEIESFESAQKQQIREPGKLIKEEFKSAAERLKQSKQKQLTKTAYSLEQRIGTRWILAAGIITVIFGVGFFLKYAYDNNMIGPLGRVVIVGVSGLFALGVGELTRRRGYGIVAKSVTALGFAMLYAAVFSAYRYYELIHSTPAFVLAIMVTLAAMLYSVSLNEVWVAVLSLLGGFLTPVIVSTGENLPTPLFCYVLILGVGAMLCSYYRKWRVVNLLAFVGTFVLYTGWFEKFFRIGLSSSQGVPEQMAIALSWLGIFFTVYLVLPILYEIVRKVKARREEVLLILADAMVTFYYLWTILFERYRVELAICSLGLCVAHLFMMWVIIRRCNEDLSLRLSLLVISLFFLTIAIPLYLRMYAVAIAWAAEGFVLALIGLKYRSILTQLGAAAAVSLSIGQLLYRLPMHYGAFVLVFNPAFGTWVFVAAVLYVCHVLYRRDWGPGGESRLMIAEFLYIGSAFLLFSVMVMEWYWYCDYNITNYVGSNSYFIRGTILIFSVFPLLLTVRPICPKGLLSRIPAMVIAAGGAVFTMIAFTEVYHDSFLIFFNLNFGTGIIFVASLFVMAWRLKGFAEQQKGYNFFPVLFALTALFVLWVLLTEQIYLYWYCRNTFESKVVNWRFLSNMYVSVMWAFYGAALMAAGFWHKLKLLRYISLGLFALLLCKVFILDTSKLESVYRIAAFLATGITLVCVSYLYQFLKKKGFFEAILAQKGEIGSDSEVLK